MKKNYDKPEIRKVKLVAPEAVLSACKSGDVLASGYSPTGACDSWVGVACNANGS